jgi:bifunctional DNase/RNase
MEVRDYWDAIVRGWWLPVVLGLVGLAVGLLVASPPKGHIETHYQSTSVIGSPPTSQNGPSLLGGGLTIGQILYYASSDGVIAQTSKLSGLNEPLPEVRGQISVVSPAGNSGQSNGDENGIVNVSAVGATPAAALALDKGFVDAMNTFTDAQATASLLAQEQQTEATLFSVLTDIQDNNFAPGLNAQALEVQVNTLQTYLANLVVQQPSSGLQVVQAPSATSTVAVVTGTPTVVDNRTLRAVVGLVAGLILGALAALALWLLDGRLKTAKRAQVALGYPVVAEIPYESSDSTEAYRMLWLTVFREPLPLPSMDQSQQLYDGEDPVLDRGMGSRSGQAGGL